MLFVIVALPILVAYIVWFIISINAIKDTAIRVEQLSQLTSANIAVLVKLMGETPVERPKFAWELKLA
jgi:hypothetical protein